MERNSITVQAQRFIDRQGRQVMLHGLNLVDKNPAAGYLSYQDEGIFAQMQEWGLNCVRLGVIWDGLEPEPGAINETYLQGLQRQLDLSHAHGLMVFLDMHQDLFSVLFSDGAPAWATLTDGAPHLAEGGVWSDAYFSSPAVQKALDNFWDNAPAPDGIGLQAHYAHLWGVLAERFCAHPALIGYDLMNEPNPGALSGQALAALFTTGAAVLSEQGLALPVLPGEPGDPLEALMQVWLSPQGRFQILQALQDVELYAAVVDSTQALYNAFEQEKLTPMYQRAARAIRAVDAEKMIFLETSMGSNMGAYSAIQPLELGSGGYDPHQVYAPHGYDLVTDTEFLAQASPERVRLIFERHAETACRLGMPMLVGEWGAYGDAPGTLAAARQVVGVFEELLCSETYWAYIPGIESTPSFPAIQRPYPERVGGHLLAYRYEPAACTFTCTWQEYPEINAPSRIYLPDWFGFDPAMLEIEPPGSFQVVPARPGSRSLFLEIPPLGKALKRTVSIRQAV